MNSLKNLLIFCFWCCTTLLFATSQPIFSLTDAPASVLSKTSKKVDATYLQLDKTALKSLYDNSESTIEIQIPQKAKSPLTITLTKKQLLSDNFYLSTQNESGRQIADYEPGNYYHNTSPESLSAISVFENSIAGVITVNDKIYTLGVLQSERKSAAPIYIFYDEKQLDIGGFECGTADAEFNQAHSYEGAPKMMMDRVIQNYLEIDYRYYFFFDNDLTATANEMTAIFNIVQTIFNSEDVDMQISELSIWTATTPYSFFDSGTVLNDFVDANECINGDLAHFFGRASLGGLAYLNALCGTRPYAVSTFFDNFQEYPTYSWPPNVIAHEAGHNLGSPHTHACAWNGNNTAIDGCGPEAGYETNCPVAPLPTGGTIMSYCHLLNVGVDLALGFGQQPGDRIREFIDSRTCLGQIEYVTIFPEDFYLCVGDNVNVNATIDGCQGCTYNWSDGIQGPTRNFQYSNLPAPLELCIEVTNNIGTTFKDHIRIVPLIDNDGDGICSPEDCNDFNPDRPTTPETPCNDFNPSTGNDVIQEDGCTCRGTFGVGTCDISVYSENGNIIIEGLTSDLDAKIFNSSFFIEWNCNPFGGTPCNPTEIVGGLIVGDTYRVTVNGQDCAISENLILMGGDNCVDQDEDGICREDDCNDFDPFLPLPPGAPCDDFNPNTTNDEIQQDGCTCVGMPFSGNNPDLTAENLFEVSGTLGEVVFFPFDLLNLGQSVAVDDYVIQTYISTDSNLSGDDIPEGTIITGNTPTGTLFDVVGGITIPTNIVPGDYFLIMKVDDNNDIQESNENNNIIFTELTIFPITDEPTCSDGIQNQGETGVDCGGPCTPCSTGGCNVSITSSNGGVTITGLTSAENAKLFTSNIQSVWGCDPWNDNCSNNETVTGLVVGDTYFLSVQSAVCDEWIPIVIQGGGSNPTCNDGIQNQGETGIDCGGPCEPCTTTGCNVNVSSFNGSITVTGLTSAENTKLFNANIQAVWECNPWNSSPCTANEVINGLIIGATYFLSVQSSECNEWIPIVVEGGGCMDSDGDGVCNADDCQPTNPNLPTTPGSPCNDFNANTTNDVIQADGCTCAGTPTGGGCNVNITSANGGVTITGLNSSYNTKLFNANVQPVWECNPWTGAPCSNNETVNGLIVGDTYFLSVQSNDCNEWIPIVIQGGGGGGNLPDLRIADFSSDSGAPGEVVFFSFDLINQGTTSANGSYDITTYISTNNTLSNDDIQEGNIGTGNTVVGTEQDVVGAITVPSNLAPGNYFLIIRVDDNNTIAESNENNNVTSTSLTITGGNSACNTPSNIAVGKSASQSSTLNFSGINATASLAVDNNTNGNFFAGSIAATNFENNAWWQVDLGSNYDINAIEVFNRTEGNDRLNDFYVMISNTPYTSNSLNTARNQSSQEKYYSGQAGTPSTWNVSNGSGRYVRIQRNSSGYLTLAELKVNGCPISLPDNTDLFKTSTKSFGNVFEITSLFPNPVQQELLVQLNNSKSQQVSIEIIDVMGKLQFSKFFNMEEGTRSIPIQLDNLSHGIYNLIIRSENGDIKSKKFVKS